MEELLNSSKINFMNHGNLSRIFVNPLNPMLVAPTLYLKEATADVYFLIEENEEIHRIPAHKCILAERSPVFFQMFYGPLKEKADVTTTDKHFIVSRNGFEGFLQIFYSYDMQITSANVCEIYLLADKYDIQEWKPVCIQFLIKTLTIKTYFIAWELGLKFGLVDLIKLCEKTLKEKAVKIFSSSEFLEISQDTLKSILSVEMYYCHEFSKFNACVKWARSACERKGIDSAVLKNCRQELGECFALIRLDKMNEKEFLHFQSNFLDIVSMNELNELLKVFTSIHLLDETDEEDMIAGTLSDTTTADSDEDYTNMNIEN